MHIFFVYDTTYCKSEEEDPKDAVIYFFPKQISEKNFSLCGQVVGVARFCKVTFSGASIIVLDQEKFALLWHGKYLLVLGSNSYTHTNVLKRKLSFLYEMFCFYHGSMEIVMESSNSRSDFLAKMDLAWSRYFHFIQCFDNFLQVPVHPWPLTSLRKQVQAEYQARQFLQKCQLSSSVVAGGVLCNGRILYSQFTPEVTSYLTLLSNANASVTVKNVEFKKSLPFDVELKYVYLSGASYCSIIKYNHTSAGSAVRVKQCANISGQKHHSFDVINSGSEGDIDSGNDCDSGYLQRTDSKMESYFDHALDCKHQMLCCTTHESLFKKNLCFTKNSVFKNLQRSDEAFDDLSTYAHDNKFKKVIAKPTNLICDYHADFFTAKLSTQHPNASSSCDMEFCCYFCINYSHFWSSTLLKNWNSSIDISTFTSMNTKLFNSDKRTSCCKIQILKCRSRKGKKKNSFSKRLLNESKPAKRPIHIQSADMDRHVLYVQRCGGNTFLLLLRKNFEENILSFLWDSILSFLKSLDSTMLWYLKHNDRDWLNTILLYDNRRQTVKEHPIQHGSDPYVQELVQSIQEDFTSNSKEETFSLMSNNVNVFALQRSSISAFYVSKDIGSSKVESLCSLCKRASHKMEKYLRPH